MKLLGFVLVFLGILCTQFCGAVIATGGSMILVATLTILCGVLIGLGFRLVEDYE